MPSQFWLVGGSPGILHHYTETLVTFEFISPDQHKADSILFVGGLGDGLATTSYTAELVQALATTSWSLFTLTLTSSYQAWGLGHLDRDTTEIAQCISHIQTYKTEKYGGGRIVLMGHSTGSQNVLHYLYRPNPHPGPWDFDPELQSIIRPALDGAIMQAPVSDREASQQVLKYGYGGKTGPELRPIYEQLEVVSKQAVENGRAATTLLPLWMTGQLGYMNAPVSCRRFLSLVSPDSPQSPEEDDLFSSDLSDEEFAKTFGNIKNQGLLKGKLLVLVSGSDQSLDSSIDKQALFQRWLRATNVKGAQVWDDVNSAIIPNASHALSNHDQAIPRRELCRRVLRYIEQVGKGK